MRARARGKERECLLNASINASIQTQACMYKSVLMIMSSGGNDRFVFGTRVFLSTVIFLASYDNGFAKRNFCPTAVLSHGLRQTAFDIFSSRNS